jgi:2-polyprenyl-3-methyl-5-hydroxy-6-metoxy-1,4-benzoquinol methylase
LNGHNYSSEYFEHIEKGYYPFSYLRDRVIIHFVKKLIPKGKRILEIGCGTGRCITQIENKYETYGMDISEYAIKQAQTRSRKTKFSATSLENLDAFEKQFDGVIAINIIEHLAEPDTILLKINKVLSNNGFLFVHLPTVSNKLSKILLNRFYKDDTHVFITSINNLNSVLLEAGFSLMYQRSGSFIFLPISNQKVLEITPPYFGIYKKTKFEHE